MHQRYQPTAFDRHPGVQRAIRGLAMAGIAALFAAAWMTAGPGNGWQPARDHVAVSLPTVTVVGHRSALAATEAPAVACDRTASAALPRALRKTA